MNYLDLLEFKDIIDNVLYQYLNPIDIWNFYPYESNKNSIFEKCLIFNINERLKDVFGDDYDTFKKGMNDNNLVISGSFILQCILGERWQSDIDLIHVGMDNYPYKRSEELSYLGGLLINKLERFNVIDYTNLEKEIEVNNFHAYHSVKKLKMKLEKSIKDIKTELKKDKNYGNANAIYGHVEEAMYKSLRQYKSLLDYINNSKLINFDLINQNTNAAEFNNLIDKELYKMKELYYVQLIEYNRDSIYKILESQTGLSFESTSMKEIKKKDYIPAIFEYICTNYDFDVCANIFYRENGIDKVKIMNLENVLNRKICTIKINILTREKRLSKYKSRGFTFDNENLNKLEDTLKNSKMISTHFRESHNERILIINDVNENVNSSTNWNLDNGSYHIISEVILKDRRNSPYKLNTFKKYRNDVRRWDFVIPFEELK